MARLITALLLFFILPCPAQNTGACNNFWLKANYTGLPQATSEKDKALQLLKSNKEHDTLKAKAYNTLGIYQDLANNPTQALLEYKKAQSYLAKFPGLQVYVDINKTQAYEALTDYAKSLEVSTAALKQYKKTLTPQTTALLYHTQATAYFRMSDISSAASYALKGIALLEKQKDSCYVYLLKLTLANTYIQTNNYDFALTLFEEYFKNNGHARGTKVHTIALVNYSECFIALEKYNDASRILTDAIPDVEKAGDKELVAILYYRLGNLEDQRGNTATSLSHYKKAYALLGNKKSRFSTNIFSGYLNVLDKAKKYTEALALAQSFKNTVSYRKGNPLERYNFEMAVAEIYKKTNMLQNANDALAEAVRISDSIRQTNNGTFEQQLQAQYQTKFQAEKNALLEKKLQAEEHLLLMYLIISIAIMIVILLFLRSYKLRNRLNKEHLKTMEADKVLADNQRAHEQELSRSQQLTLEEKEREVTSMALRIASYYDNINDLIDKYSSNKHEGTHDIKKDLQQLIAQKEYWKLFETRFNNANPNFASNLKDKFDKLTKNDIEFCTLLKLKLANKEIASLLQISHESVITKKYRIKKKMDINSDEEFDELLAII